MNARMTTLVASLLGAGTLGAAGLAACAPSPRMAAAISPSGPTPAAGSSRDPEPPAPALYFEPESPHLGLPIAARIPVAPDEFLLVMRDGLRVLQHPPEPERTAPIGLLSAHHDLVDVVRLADGTFVALDDTGRTASFREPLGEVLAQTSGVGEEVEKVELGYGAVVALTKRRVLRRSTDGGEHWTDCTFPGDPGINVAFALRHDGRGVVLRAPQRVFATVDDGATWTQLPAVTGEPNAVLERWVERTEAGDLVVGEDAGKDLVVDFSKLRIVPAAKSKHLAPESASYSPSFLPSDAKEGSRLVSGSRVYLGRIRDGEIAITTTTLAASQGERAATEWRAGLSSICGSPQRGDDDAKLHLAAQGPVVAAAFRGCGDDETSRDPEFVLLKSSDAGKSFARVPIPAAAAKVGPALAAVDSISPLTLSLLRDGTVFLAQGAGPFGMGTAAVVRVSKTGQTSVIANDDALNFEALPSGRIVVLARHPANGRPYLLISDSGGDSFRKVELPDPKLPSGQSVQLVPYADGQGTLGFDLAGRAVIVLPGFLSSERRGVGLRALLGENDALDISETVEGIQLEGAHGLVSLENGELEETADGAATFWRTPVAGASRLGACSEGTCDFGAVVRQGWARTGPGPLTFASLADRPEPIVPPKEPPIAVHCTGRGRWMPFSASGDFKSSPHTFDPGVLWLGHVRGSDGRVTGLVLVRQGANLLPKEIPLLPAANEDRAPGFSFGANGVVAFRYGEMATTTTGPAPSKPVLQLGWLDLKTLRVRSTILREPPTEVGAATLENAVLVTDQEKKQPARLLLESGELKELLGFSVVDSAVPEVSGRANDFLVFQEDLSGVLWRTRISNFKSTPLPPWLVGEAGILPGVTNEADHFALGILDASGDPRVLAIDGSDPSPEPPIVRNVALDQANLAQRACRAGERSSMRFHVQPDRGRVQIVIDKEKPLDAQFVGMRADRSGAACVSNVVMTEPERTKVPGGDAYEYLLANLMSPGASARFRTLPKGKRPSKQAPSDESDTNQVEWESLECSFAEPSK